MPLATQSDLVSSVANWMDRTDLTAVIPDFISLFEATANTEAAIRTQFNKTSVVIPTVSGQNYISTPADFIGLESLINQSVTPLESLNVFGSASALYTAFPNAVISPQRPKGVLVLAGKLELAYTPDAIYNLGLYYYQRIPALTALAPTNWLLTNYPNIYLFGTLVAAEAFLGTDPALSKWGSLYDNAIQRLEGATERQKYGAAAPRSQSDRVV